MSDAVQKLHSTVRCLLNATAYATINGNHDKWLEYFRSLAAGAETTIEEIERLKKDLDSLITTLSETNVLAHEKVYLPCDKTYLSIYFILFFASKSELFQKSLFSQNEETPPCVADMETEQIENSEVGSVSSRNKRLVGMKNKMKSGQTLDRYSNISFLATKITLMPPKNSPKSTKNSFFSTKIRSPLATETHTQKYLT